MAKILFVDDDVELTSTVSHSLRMERHNLEACDREPGEAEQRAACEFHGVSRRENRGG